MSAALAQLTDTERDVLLVLALTHDVLARGEWWSRIKERGGWVRNMGELNRGTHKQLARRLAATGIVVQRQPGFFGVTAQVALALIEAADRESPRRVDRMLKPEPRAWRVSPIGTLRIGIVRGDAEMVSRGISGFGYHFGRDAPSLLRHALGEHIESGWLALLPAKVCDEFVRAQLRDGIGMLAPVPEAVGALAAKSEDAKLRLLVMRWRAMRGVADPAAGLGRLPKWGSEGAAVLGAFWRGEYREAADLGDAAVAAMGKRKHKFLPELEGLAHGVASMSQVTADPGRRQRVYEMLLDASARGKGNTELMALAGVARAIVEPKTRRPHVLGWWTEREPPWIRAWIEALVAAWWPEGAGDDDDEPPWRSHRVDKSDDTDDLAAALRLCLRRAREGGYDAVATVLDDALQATVSEAPSGGLAASLVPPPAWEAALASVEAVAADIAEPAARDSPRHAKATLRWEVQVGEHEARATPRLAKTARARKGTPISLDRLASKELEGVRTAHDSRVLAAAEVEEDRYGYGYPARQRKYFGSKAVGALVDHPGVIDCNGKPVEVIAGAPRICTVVTPAGIRVSMFPSASSRRELVIEQPDEGRVVVYRRPDHLRSLAELVATKSGLVVPEQGRERLSRALAAISARSGVELVGELAVPTRSQSADCRPVFALQWDGDTLLASARVAPLGIDGPHVAPGLGARVLVAPAPRDGKQDESAALLRCDRDHAEERTALADVLDRCPQLSGFATAQTDWAVAGLADALSVVEELHACGDDVALAWRKGKKLYPPKVLEVPDLSVRVRGAGMQLALSAKLAADEGLVLGFAELLSAREGRFVRLGDDKIFALSAELRRRIDGLARLGQADDDALQLHVATLPAVQTLLDGATARYDAATRKRLSALDKVAEQTPRVPRGFGSVLRDYQREGFAWLWRRAAAGFGACLADDMGLGKTVQALAVLADRNRSGPAIVVCPTSVVFNWRQESERFAPGLRVHVLATAADRAACISSMSAGDVLVVSYGLLVTERKRLHEVGWATAVFDEAHAVKNATTKRSRAARALPADFVLALTGTPVENNLAELWSLLHLLVPGLLGDRDTFVERFANPIADGRREPLTQLRAVVRHFILRRTKAQVLDELPPRTDTTIVVEPSAAARAFYEARRRQAQKKVQAAAKNRKKITALAEITKLRQAAVDPRVCDPAVGPPGAKIDLLLQELSRLAESDHRALVFTQFLDSLALIEQGLKEAGITYQTLQGSTPAAERAARIEAFSAGEGVVFLASLRAGGIGVNLTAADFVYHVDPWWNPAVEDQATDRAHRIGQTRPVQVYRLVTAGTIEEKILDLHERKRGLADGVLAGLQSTQALDLDELVALLGG